MNMAIDSSRKREISEKLSEREKAKLRRLADTEKATDISKIEEETKEAMRLGEKLSKEGTKESADKIDKSLASAEYVIHHRLEQARKTIRREDWLERKRKLSTDHFVKKTQEWLNIFSKGDTLNLEGKEFDEFYSNLHHAKQDVDEEAGNVVKLSAKTHKTIVEEYQRLFQLFKDTKKFQEILRQVLVLMHAQITQSGDKELLEMIERVENDVDKEDKHIRGQSSRSEQQSRIKSTRLSFR